MSLVAGSFIGVGDNVPTVLNQVFCRRLMSLVGIIGVGDWIS